MRKKLIIIAVICSLLVVFTISTFAYFKVTDSKQIETSRSLTSDLIEISSSNDLINYSKSSIYNDHNESSEVSNDTAARRTLKFKSNIVLHNDIEITTDCNMDLNGYKLYLNGYNLYINHSYYGTFQLYSSKAGSLGMIYPKQVTVSDDVYTEVADGTNGYISINTPNAIVITNKIGVYNIDNTGLILGDYVINYSCNDLYLSYNALYYVSDALVDYTDIRPDKLLPKDITLGTNISTVNSKYSFKSSLFIPARASGDSSVCEYSNTVHCCSYIYQDIDLPFNYLNFKDITIEYVSSNTNVVSNYGEVTLPSTYSNVTLTANIKKNGTIIATSDFNLHVINPNSTEIIKAAKAIFYSRIADHYNNDDGIYIFDREILLPAKVGDATIEYEPYKISSTGSYELFNDETKYESLGSSTVNEYPSDNDYILDFSPTSETSALGVKITLNASSETFYIKMTSNNLIINNEYSIARDIVNEWYAGKISLKKNGTNDYDTLTLKDMDDLDTNRYPTVTAVSYELINDSHNLYGISSTDPQILSVSSGATPENYVDNVMLSCNFTIGGKIVKIQIPVNVKLSESTLANEFLPYYTYYDEIMKYTYNNYNYQNFEMPFAYSNTGPIICYDFAIVPNNYSSLEDKTLTINPALTSALKVYLYYNGSENLLSFSEGNSYTAALDSYLSTNSLTLENILSYGDAKWIYKLDVANVPNSNTSLALVYNYKMTHQNNIWTVFCEGTTDDQKITRFTLAGVLHYGSDVISEVFYKWIYDNFTILADENNDQLEYSTGDYEDSLDDASKGKYVLIDWLQQNVKVDVTEDATIASITDFTGLQFLVGTKELNLTGAITDAAVAINVAREIAKMKSLETLILKNCTGFTDGKTPWLAVDEDNDSISRFVKLKNLKVLNVESCNIVLFDFMDTMTWLSEAHVANQVLDSNQYYSNIYANRGIVNLYVFADLTSAGVKVFNTYSGTAEMLFEEQKDINDYLRLKQGIVYQSKLAYDVDIRQLFSSFSTTVSDYHMDKYYKNQVNSGQLNVTQISLEFVAVLDVVTYVKATGTYDNTGLTPYYVVDVDSATGYSIVTTPSVDDFANYYVGVTYVKATGSYDSSAAYYVEDEESATGYSIVTSSSADNFANYYVPLTVTYGNCTAFMGIYTFNLQGATNNSVLKVKFNVERY